MFKINNVTKRYRETVILENSSYTFPEKGIVCLMGASGGGKTTLLNLLAGFDTDYDGDILVGGTSISKMNADKLCEYRKDNIGFVFQNYHLLPGYTVLENVMRAYELTGEEHSVSMQKAKGLLKRLSIGEKEHQKIENLSGGQKQRVAIARALMSDPNILFADEPTGALDRTMSTEIMNLLCEISQDRLVIVITHDRKICDFADEIIHIKDKKIVEEQTTVREEVNKKVLINNKLIKMSGFDRGIKNFKVHMKRYIAVSLAISIGMLAFLFSLSFGNIMEQSIEGFKIKNTAFNNGYIKGEDDGSSFDYLVKDERVENVYYQYKLGEITLSINDKKELMPEKFPMPKATEDLSYGVMPRRGMSEISLSPSLAKKFNEDIKNLIGKEVILRMDDQKHILTVSGIYNAGYDDFFVSSDVEQLLYKDLPQQSNYSISYDVKDFNDIVTVNEELKGKGVTADTAVDEVGAFQDTFSSLNKLFLVISVLVLAIGLFICIVLLVKLQNTRYREVGLLSALGFRSSQIRKMITTENLLLSSLATIVNFILLGGSMLVSRLLNLSFVITGTQLTLSIIATFAIVIVLSGVVSYKLVHTEPAVALGK